MDVRMPDGTVIGGVPDGTSRADLVAKLKANGYDVAKMFTASDPTIGATPTEGTGSNLLAGIGQGMTNLARGAGQRLGIVPQEDIDRARALDAPLMATGAGATGSAIGTALPAVLTAPIPGANTLAGAALVGGGLGALQPTAEGESVAANAAIGAGAGAVGQLAGRGLSALNAMRGAKGAQQAAANAVRDTTAQSARRAGYTLPPTEANPTSWINRIFEGVAGKLTTRQAASAKNQTVTNRLVREALGLAPDAPLTDDVLRGVAKQAAQAYQPIRALPTIPADAQFAQELSQIGGMVSRLGQKFPGVVSGADDVAKIADQLNQPGFSGDDLLDLLRQLRADAKSGYKAAAMGNPEKLAAAQARKDAAGALENLLDRHLQSIGADDVLANYRGARQMIAKVADVEDALDAGSGNVIARELTKKLERGSPLTGELRQVAETAQAFPRAMQNPAPIGSQPGISPLDVYGASGITAATGNPAMMGLLLGRPLARSAILSSPYQALMTAPQYGPGLLSRAAGGLLENPYGGMAARSLLGAYATQQ